MAKGYDYIAYVDEAGDPGLGRVRPVDPEGSSEWLVLSALVVRACREAEVDSWLLDIKKELHLAPHGVIHFRNLGAHRRAALAKLLARRPVRCFAVCSNKKNMRGYRNERAEKIPSQEWFYNWCIRMLLERVTGFCGARRRWDDWKSGGRIKIEFSRRRRHRYSQTNAYMAYLRHRKQTGALTLTKRVINTDLLSTELMEDHPHGSRGGLQLADVIASAFFSASNTIGPGEWDIDPALCLRPVMAKERGVIRDFGVALQPTPPWRAKLTARQRQIYEAYGYDFRRTR